MIISQQKTYRSLFVMVLVYLTLAIIRSLAILLLFYVDSSFIEFDFAKDQLLEKNNIFNNYYFYAPYLIGIGAIIFINLYFKFNGGFYLVAAILGIVVFRFLDADIVRPVFGIFENTVINVVLSLIVFLSLAYVALKTYSTKGGSSNPPS
ncbi:hypothetical protein [Spongiimicrobium sp. 2-473A-2-J]|uniref:hypothetical protein n=1 Tax=Eudoraea algarum TaxID=3417568 RepID=UPI003D36E0B8